MAPEAEAEGLPEGEVDAAGDAVAVADPEGDEDGEKVLLPDADC